MILESVLRLANSHAKKKGKLPSVVTIHRGKLQFAFHKHDYLAMASKITNIRHSIKKGEEHAQYLVRTAAYTMYQYRLKSPVAGWCLKDVEKGPLHKANIVDLRPGYRNGLSGLAYERVKAVFNPELTMYKTTARHYALVNAVENVDAVLVETRAQAAMLQAYFAKRCIRTVVLLGSDVEGYYDAVQEDGFTSTKVVAHG